MVFSRGLVCVCYAQGFFVNNISGYAKFFPVFFFKYNPTNLQFQAEFLTFFSHLPQKQSLSSQFLHGFYTFLMFLSKRCRYAMINLSYQYNTDIQTRPILSSFSFPFTPYLL